jgi:hypothetical protein
VGGGGGGHQLLENEAGYSSGKNRAGRRIRTDDLLITNLHLLSAENGPLQERTTEIRAKQGKSREQSVQNLSSKIWR